MGLSERAERYGTPGLLKMKGEMQPSLTAKQIPPPTHTLSVLTTIVEIVLDRWDNFFLSLSVIRNALGIDENNFQHYEIGLFAPFPFLRV